MMNDDLTFMHCDYMPRCRARVDKIFKGYASVQFMEAGSVTLSYDDRRYDLSGAWVWTAWPGPQIRFHAGKGSDHWSHRYVAFRGSGARALADEGLFPYEPVRAPQPVSDARLFDELLRYTGRTDPRGRALASAHLELFLRRLKDGAEGRTSTAQIIHDVRFILDRLGQETPDYEAVAAEMGMAESTLRRRFFKASGKAIHSFFIDEKIGEARNLLINSKLSIAEISDRLGYRDVFYFTRQFKKQVGTPPSAFRNSAQV